MNRKSKVIILVGNIGSGKSTIAIEYQKKGYIVISKDQLRYAIGGGKYIFSVHLEPVVWQTELYMYKKFLRLGVDIIIDGTNVSRALRSKYIEDARYYDYKIICREMPKLSLKESVSRRMTNPHQRYDKRFWESLWTIFDNKYEKPTKKEGFNQIIRK